MIGSPNDPFGLLFCTVKNYPAQKAEKPNNFFYICFVNCSIACSAQTAEWAKRTNRGASGENVAVVDNNRTNSTESRRNFITDRAVVNKTKRGFRP